MTRASFYRDCHSARWRNCAVRAEISQPGRSGTLSTHGGVFAVRDSSDSFDQLFQLRPEGNVFESWIHDVRDRAIVRVLGSLW